MLTVTVSLATVWAPEPVGVTLTLTVPLVVKALITELIAEFTVVDAVAAPAMAGDTTKVSSVATAGRVLRILLVLMFGLVGKKFRNTVNPLLLLKIPRV